MNNMFLIAFNDVYRVLKDKQAVLWMLVMPLVFIYLFGNIMVDQTNIKVWLPVFNHDEHELSSLFIEQLKGEEKFIIDIRSATEEQWVKNWPRAVILPATFSEDILRGESVDIEFVQGRGNFEQTLAAQTHVFDKIVKYTGALASVDVVQNKWTANTQKRFEDELNKNNILQIEEKKAFTLRPPPSGFGFTLPAYLVLFMLTNTVMFGGVTLVSDRANHQLMRLASTPTAQYELLIGKLMGYVFVPMIQAIILLAVGNLIIGIPLGDHPWVIAPVVICFAVCCGSLGVLFGTFCKTIQQVTGLGTLVSMLLGAMGGCWWPLEIAPDSMKAIAAFTPTYWAIRGLNDVMAFGKSIDGVWLECLVLLSFAAAFSGIAMPILRKKVF